MHDMNKTLKSGSLISIIICLFDIISVAAAYLIALLLRFDFRYSLIHTEYLNTYTNSIFIVAIITVAIFYFLKLYQSIWKYASYRELIFTFLGTAFSFVDNKLFTPYNSLRTKEIKAA